MVMVVVVVRQWAGEGLEMREGEESGRAILAAMARLEPAIHDGSRDRQTDGEEG